MSLAATVLERVRADAQPTHPQLHLLPHGDGGQLLIVNGSRLYDLPLELVERFEAAERSGGGAIDVLLASLGLDAPLRIDDVPLTAPPVHALSLAVAQKCNLGCNYCYARQGSFGAAPTNMPLEVALQSIDLLLRDKEPGDKVHVAFMGGEPLQNRAVLRATTEYAARQAAQRNVRMGFAITTNGTLLKPADAEFFETHGFAVTVSLDGWGATHDQLRPLKNGRGSFELILRQLEPLLTRQRAMQVSARVTVTPDNLELLATLDAFIELGFHSVGFSPLLNAPSGRSELDAAHLDALLQAMIECGLHFEQQVLKGRRYPFLNMVNALRELHRGSHRPYPCGAGAGYFGVSAEGQLSACHRFVGDEQGQLGTLGSGVDVPRQNEWLRQRHVHTQSPCSSCWARYLCGGGCHHEVLARGRGACDYIRGWLHYCIQAYGRLSRLTPSWFAPEPM